MQNVQERHGIENPLRDDHGGIESPLRDDHGVNVHVGLLIIYTMS